jgi:hypothetical protein
VNNKLRCQLLRPRSVRENLLVVEVKKATNKAFDGDIWKLKGMTEQPGPYVKEGRAPRSDVYVDAELDETLTAWMQLELGREN